MKKAEMRENIADLLDQLPDTLQSCEDYAAVYPGKNTLRNRIEDLYIRIVEAIETLIIWYSKKSLSSYLPHRFTALIDPNRPHDEGILQK